MFDPFKKLKLAGAFLGVAVDDAAAAAFDSPDISELFGRLSLKDLRGMSLPADSLLEQPGVRALYESRYMPEPEPLDRLTALGDGTLGFEYARYLRQSKLSQPTPSRRIDFNDPAAYLAERVRMTHPLLHLIAEYDASPLGELALQAYYIGQTGNLISGVILSSALLQITRDTPDQLGPALEVTSEAYQRGKIARSFLGIAWEELWSAQVPQLRELLEIPARSSAVALLRFVTPTAAPPEPRASRSGSSFSAFSNTEDGFAALGRANSGSSNSSSSSASNNSTPPPRPRNFTGFGGAPLKPEPDPPTPRKPAVAPTRPEPRRDPAAPEQRPRQASSSSSLLASFMALSEQAANPEPEPAPAPVKPPPQPQPQPQAQPPQPLKPQPPQPQPPRVDARAPVKPPPLAPPAKPGEPGYKIEEAAKNTTPALSPDDPDYF